MVTSADIYIWKLLTVISILILNHILKHNKIYNILKHTKTPIICSHALQFSRICSFKIEKHLYSMYRLWFFNRVYPESLTGIKRKKMRKIYRLPKKRSIIVTEHFKSHISPKTYLSRKYSWKISFHICFKWMKRFANFHPDYNGFILWRIS